MSLSEEMYNHLNGPPPPDPSKIKIARNLDSAARAYHKSLTRRADDDYPVAANPSENAIIPRTRASSASVHRTPHDIPPRSSTRQAVVSTDPSRYAAYYTDSDRLVFPASSTNSRRHRRYSRLSDGYPSYRRKELKPKSASGEHHTTASQSSGTSYQSADRSPNQRDLDLYDPFTYTNYREKSHADSDSFTNSHPGGLSCYIRGKKHRPLSLSGLDEFLPPVHYDTKRSHRIPPRERNKDQGKEESSNGYRQHDRTGRHSHRTPVSLHQQRHELSPYSEDYLRSRENKEYSIRQSEDGTVIVDDRPYHGDRDRSHKISRRATEPERGREPKYSQHLAPKDMPSGDGPSTSRYSDGYSTESSDTRRHRRGRYKQDRYASEKYRMESDVSEYDSDRRSRRYRHRDDPRRVTSRSNGNIRREHRPRESDSEDSDSGSNTDRPVRPSTKTAHEHRPKDTPGAKEMQQKYNHNPLSNHAIPPEGRQPNPEMQQRHSPPSRSELPSSPRGTPKQPDHDIQPRDNPSSNPDTPPKGILKQPTRKFPEDPNAVREGVAPLKEEAEKKGAPEGARWTKIRKSLVSPAALEGRERFEERTDDVIVLRVLSQEEIEAYSNRTAEIRRMFVEVDSSHIAHSKN